MKKFLVPLTVLLMVVSIGFSGCGKKQTTTVETSSTTLGQELIDLQQAYEKGIITEREYNNLRKQAMKKYK